MQNIEGFDFIALKFDSDGNVADTSALNDLKQRAATVTDAIFIAHGFRNSEADASDLYSEFLKNFRANLERQPELASLKARRFVVAGVFWPSKTLPESAKDRSGGSAQSAGDDEDVARQEKREARKQLVELRDTVATEDQKPRIDRAIQLLEQLDDSTAAQDEFAASVKSLLDCVSLEQNEGLEKFKSQPGSEALRPARNTRDPARLGRRWRKRQLPRPRHRRRLRRRSNRGLQ
jgi:hypothetical protein